MKGTRFWIIFACAALAAALFLIGYLVWQKLDASEYETRLVRVLGGAGEDGVTAEIGGVTTIVTEDNRGKLISWLCVAGREKHAYPEGADPDEITIRAGDSMTIAVRRGDEEADESFVRVTDGSWMRSFRIAGYRTYAWVARTAGAEGYYGANPVKP